MPAAVSLLASITLNARDGITTKTTEKVRDFVRVAYQKGEVSLSRGVLEPNKRGGVHLHVAILFTKPQKVASDVKQRFKTLLKEELQDTENCGDNFLVCKPHKGEYYMLIAGYYQKDDGVQDAFSFGIHDETALKAGSNSYNRKVEAKARRSVTKNEIPKLFVKAYHYILFESRLPGSEREGVIPYDKIENFEEEKPEKQIDLCLNYLISQGYTSLLMEMGPGKINFFAKHWEALCSLSPE